jgi:glycosyltransferase involved in cell wall biosynthesis
MTQLKARWGAVRDWSARRGLSRHHCRLIAVADQCAAEIAEFVHSMTGPAVTCVPNGVPEAAPIDREAVRREWFPQGAGVIIGCAARLEEEKNPLLPLRLLAELPACVQFVWIGDGRQRATFEATARELGVADRVHVDGWRDDAQRRMAALDVFVLASQYEGLPLALLEAMAVGLPCVASDLPGVRQAIEDSRSGRICRVNDERQWLTALRVPAADETERRRLGACARERHRANFSLDAMTRGTLAVYREAIAERRQRRGVGTR